MDTKICDGCGKACEPDGIGTGYGIASGRVTFPEGAILCYSCCADEDSAQMTRDGVTWLYLSNGEVSNWSGSLRFRAFGVTKHKINGIERERTTFRFYGPDGKVWSGVQRGFNSTMAHCKRTKLASVGA